MIKLRFLFLNSGLYIYIYEISLNFTVYPNNINIKFQEFEFSQV